MKICGQLFTAGVADRALVLHSLQRLVDALIINAVRTIPAWNFLLNVYCAKGAYNALIKYVLTFEA